MITLPNIPRFYLATKTTSHKPKWLAFSKNSKHGNARRKDSFWCEVLQYIESKTKQYCRRTYDMVCGKWKTVRPSVIRFCGIYNNVMRMAQESGAEDEDYVQRAIIHYEIKIGLPFKLRHCWEILKDRPKWQEIAIPKFATESGGSKRRKSSGSSSFNTESGEASINLNTNVGDNNEDEVQEIRRPEGRDKARAAGKNKGSKESGSSTMNEDALARLMVSEMTAQETIQHENFLEMKRREVECREREIATQKYRQEQEAMRFYLQPYDHLTGDQRMTMDEIRAKIKTKYNL
ncbi:glutathione S-transferase T3-like protein [Tanacetum coccineum]|uniref:Glutathione S-transferase T3-like protein n=1 Tax=Tanacetum coccineum TaxID=301880 RepID=A0ABQ5GVR1_9ASTR